MKLFYLNTISATFLVSNAIAFAPVKQSLSTTPKLFSTTSNTEESSTTNSFPNPFVSDCDADNIPPSLSKLIASIHSVKSGSDIRGIFTEHRRIGTVRNVIEAIKTERALTPFATYCFGAAFAQMVQIREGKGSGLVESPTSNTNFALFEEWGEEPPAFCGPKTVICVGNDPRPSGPRLADAFCRGVESIEGCEAHYTGLASTPAMFEFCRDRSSDVSCDGAVMITASHLPLDRNGLKLFTEKGGFTASDIEVLTDKAVAIATQWYDLGIVPPSSPPDAGRNSIACTEWVDYMPYYKSYLQEAIVNEVGSSTSEPLENLRIVVNPGKGSGYFLNEILKNLGADVSNSIHLEPDGSFPDFGVPNPEYKAMMEETTRSCEESQADIGIMLDFDADRSGFIVPRYLSNDDGEKSVQYEALNRNRLIALLAVMFQKTSPGCTIVTDSVTSEGLSTFITDLGLNHVRYLKGYANVIGKARELTESGKLLAEVAIETSGHCAMRENGYLDDGTYTSAKLVSLLAKLAKSNDESDEAVNVLDLISGLKEMEEVEEFRINVEDGAISTTNRIYQQLMHKIENQCNKIPHWALDAENLEGVRVRIGNGGFFMLRKSLHDPLLSVQVEGSSKEYIKEKVLIALLELVEESDESSLLDLSSLRNY